jgi:hypothetical protein
MRFFVTGAYVLACLSSLEPALAQQNRAAELETGTVEVVGTTPLPGLGTPLSQVPANVQGATGDQITEQHSHNITEYMETNLGNVSINEGQVNPYMPDVNFRGFTASPLLGTPQGLSVFFDGVRVNEPFGDVVNWDLIPQNALSTINLIPGSNPVFGLNTLGAALSLSTKSGLQYPGGSASLQGGSWGRKQAEFEYGGQGQSLDYFFAGNFADEDGWRQHSSSRVQQFFTKVGRETETSDFDVSLTLADNKLEGVQALPMSMLGDRNQSYTWPDRNKNELFAVNAKASHFLSAERLLAGNVYVRHYKNSNFSSNVNDECTDNTVNANFCNIGAGGGAANGEPQGANDTSTVRTLGYGGSVQMTFLEDLMERRMPQRLDSVPTSAIRISNSPIRPLTSRLTAVPRSTSPRRCKPRCGQPMRITACMPPTPTPSTRNCISPCRVATTWPSRGSKTSLVRILC